MINVIKRDKRHFSDFGWLKTYWLFSFSEYYDPNNIQFGALRVFNDDVVEAKTGFPTHPHQEMEIITIPISGEITHKDSMGNETVIKTGDVQRMSAGTGLTHSEFNLADESVHFYQIWIYPDIKRLQPTYDQHNYGRKSWKNRLFPVASGQGVANTVTFFTDATIYRSELDKDKTIIFDAKDTRRIFIYLTSGNVEINGTKISAKDQVRIDEESKLTIKAVENSDFVLIDVPSCKGWGYDKETLQGARQ